MISFRCNCGEPFEVPAELAGDSMQCPACKRLVDVPLLGDAAATADDGTVRMGEAHRRKSGLEDQFLAFGGKTDMRPTVEEFMIAGTGPAPEPAKRATPRYDPVTGELMVPMEIADDDLPPAPVLDPNAAVLGYARRAVPGKSGKTGSLADTPPVTWWTLPWALVSGMSLMAMTVIFVAHVVISLLMMLPGFSILWLLPSLFVTITVIAHYCNTMEDFGPANMERVPVLLRTASFEEDALRPLFWFGMSLLYSFGPLVAVSIFSREHFYRDNPSVLFALVAWGLLLFPLAIFTTVCGGTLHNLMPHRLLSVVKVAPGKLALAMATFWLAVVAYGIAGSFIEFKDPAVLTQSLPGKAAWLAIALSVLLTIVSYALAVYLMHIAAAWMGLIYRDHWLEFNWLLQRHEKVHARDRMDKIFRQRGQPPTVTTLDPRRSGLPRPPQHQGFEVKI